jgi:hypothetical protein
VDVDQILRDLADDPSEYLRQGGQVLMTRQGKEHAFILHDSPGVGIVVQDPDKLPAQHNIPLLRYVQQELLELPRLASQIVRTIDRASATRPTTYIEGSAEVTVGKSTVHWSKTSSEFRRYLSEQELGTTRLVQLMAGAGQGKTVLLEQLAKDTASAYQPDSYPAPFLLTVDLLGRYVGTVDDAIAGSLNNTYMFPGLTQRDVALCVRNRWLILALDGFDELVARVGARDAFLRITELLDQLRSAGTVILSARESFFELYQISVAIRSYLQPRQGSYSTAAIRLLQWGEEQGRNVFASLRSSAPEVDLRELLQAFGDDSLILQPFFLTRLARLWVGGERFSDAASQTDRRWRTQYIIETFIDRESNTKWTNRDGRPLLPPEGHTVLLSGIAEEMWRSGAFRLSEEELRIAAEMSLSGTDIPPLVLEGVVERVGTHAALMAKDRGFTFLHDRFFDYYLAVRLSEALAKNMEASCRAILSAREVSPDVLLWIEWLFAENTNKRSVALLHTLAFSRAHNLDKVFEANLAEIIGVLLSDEPETHTVRNLTFSGQALRGRSYFGQVFEDCQFWQLDLTDTVASECVFRRCEFGDVLITDGTRLSGSIFSDCTVRSLELPGDRMYFDPAIIRREIEQLGGKVETTQEFAAQEVFATRIAPEVSEAVAKLIRKTQQSFDISVEEIGEIFDDARTLVRIGRESGVLRDVAKNTSGPKKEFVRFTVDRQVLLRGQSETTGEVRIDTFWEAVAKRFPARRR